jgi:hypothetical protein
VIGGTTLWTLPDVTPAMLEHVLKGKPRRDPKAKRVKGTSGLQGKESLAFVYRENKTNFDLVGWVRGTGWEMVDYGGHDIATMVCPNVDMHTEDSTKDVACVAINTGYQHYKHSYITCLHGHCRDLSTETMMSMICEELNPDGTNPMPLIKDFLLEWEEEELEEVVVGAEQTAEQPKPAKATKPYAKAKKLLKGSGFTVESGIECDGVPEDWFTYMKPDGEEGSAEMISQAFEVVGQTRSFDGKGWGAMYDFTDADGVAHKIISSKAEIASGKIKEKFAHEGVTINPLTKFFEPLLTKLRPKAKIRLATTPGWVAGEEGVFVCPNGVVVGALGDGETVLFATPMQNQVAGTLEDQLKAFDLAIRYGSPHHFIGVLAGACGVLVDRIQLDHTPTVGLTGLSGNGKTTAEQLAVSHFGEIDWNKESLLHRLQGTGSGIENKCVMATGTILVLDETKLFTGNLEQFLFSVASGGGRLRMDTTGKQRDTRLWRTFAVVSSEHGLAQQIEAAGKQADIGFTARVADIDTTGTIQIPDVIYVEMMGLLSANFGHIGPLFVQRIIDSKQTPEQLRAEIDAKSIALAGEGATSQVWRSAGVFAIMWQAGDMLQAFGLLPPSLLAPGEIEQRIREIWTTYQGSEEAGALKIGNTDIDKLRTALFTRQGGEVQELGASIDNFREAWAWYDKEGTYYVRSDKLLELAGGGNLKTKALVRHLLDAGFLQVIQTKEGKNGKNMQWRVLPQTDGIEVPHYRLKFTAGVSEEEQALIAIQEAKEAAEAVMREAKAAEANARYAEDRRKTLEAFGTQEAPKRTL